MVRFQRTGRLSADVEDRRGRSGSGGTGRRAVVGGGGLGLVGLIVVVLLTVLGGGEDLGAVLDQVGAGQIQPAGAGEAVTGVTGGAAQGDGDELVSFVLDDVQALWAEQFAASGLEYDRATLVLYERGTATAGCGYGDAAAGPFYCPADERVYVDLDFFDQLASRFGAPGDFAQAYVIAHEIGHHVQHLLGVTRQVREQQQADPGAANELSVLLELQADCLAGVWAYSAYDDQLLDPGDLEEGLQAAAAVGDDVLQSAAGAPITPETWTHGSAAERVRWFRTGYDTGDPDACDTFAGA